MASSPVDPLTRNLRWLLIVSVLFAVGSGLYYLLAVPESPPEPEVRARHILVKRRSEAERILKELRAGASFEELAKKHSTDKSNKDKGGDLGWFGPGKMVPAFERAAFAAKAGTLVGPVQTQFGYHVIRVDEKR